MDKINTDYEKENFSVTQDVDGKYILCKGKLKLPDMGKYDTQKEADLIKNRLNELKVK